MEQLFEIDKYVPLIFKSPDDKAYFSFLRHSIEQNYEAENYHFSLVAMHLLYMGIVYHYIYWIYKADPERFDYILIGFHDLLKITNNENISWHLFANSGESNIFQFYRAVGIPKDQIGNLKQPVKYRNDMLHANGVYLSDEHEFELRANEYVLYLSKIHQHCEDEAEHLFFHFLEELKAIKIILQDEEEALDYINRDLIQEYGMNINSVKTFAKIGYSRYPGTRSNAKLIKTALRSIVE